MKKAALLLLLSGMAWGYQVEGNPDRYPSMGLNYSGANLSGETDYSGFIFSTKPKMKEKINDFMADIRLPIAPSLTLEFGGGYASHSLEQNDGTLFIGSFSSGVLTLPTTTDLSGPTYKAGVRVYFH